VSKVVIAVRHADSAMESVPGSVSIPAADGYHYGDEHPWGPDDQDKLVDQLREVEQALISGTGPRRRNPAGA
jgi:hypothetical protein